MRVMVWILGLCFLGLMSQKLIALEEQFAFASQTQQKDFENICKELRCVTCPNQNIAESHAPVAKAMQAEIYQRLKQGDSIVDIKSYLVSRYGDYVLYRPVMNQHTWALWALPFILLAIGAYLWFAKFYVAARKS